MKKILLLILGLLSIVPLHAQTNIAVLADPHVMGPGLLVSNGSAWKKALDDDRKLLDYSKEVFDVVVNKLLTDKPDLVLIVGDLTKDGELLSHQYVVKQLDKLRQSGVNTLVIPGNHDLGTVNSLYYDGSSTRKADVASASKFASLYKNYGYGSGSTRDPNSLSYSCEPIRGLVVIGIDTGTSGSVSSSTLNWVCNQVKAAYADDKQVIVMMHHLLFPHFVNEEDFMKNSVVSNYETVRNRLADAGVRVVLTGHVHISDIARDYNADLSKSIYDIATGSPISYPCDYRRMTLSADRMRLQVETEHVTSVPSNANYGKTAKSRLLTTMRQWARERYNQYVSDIIADAYIVHAEGNEAASRDASNILSQFNAAKSILSLTSYKNKVNDISNTVNSMLQDYSNYGVKNRQDRTNDLTLTIEMPKVNPLPLLKERIRIPYGQVAYFSENALDFTDVKRLKAYVATGYDKTTGSIILTRVNKVPAKTGVLLVGDADDYDITIASGAVNCYYQNLLVGNIAATTIYKDADNYANYYLSKSEDGVIAFYRASATGTKLGVNRSYFRVPADIPALGESGMSEPIVISSAGQVSYYSSESLDFTDFSSLKAYTATGYDYETGTIWLTRVKQVPAFTGFLLMGDEGSYSIPTAPMSMVYANMLEGHVDATMINEEEDGYINYYLSNGSNGLGYYRVDGSINLKANRSYLQVKSQLVSAHMRSASMANTSCHIVDDADIIILNIFGEGIGNDGDTATGINSVVDRQSPDIYYTLQGQRVNGPGRGLYIKNGKKILMK